MANTHTAVRSLFFLMCAFCAYTAQAQITNPFSAGVRACPDGGGINGRFFFNPNLGLEAQVNASGGTPGAPSGTYGGGSGKSTTGIVLLEYHFQVLDPSFRFFLGAGAHYGSWVRYRNLSKKEGLFGFDGMAGFEYVFKAVPIGISIDAKPSFNYVSGTTSFPNNTFGLGIRYYFGEWEEYGSDKEDKRE